MNDANKSRQVARKVTEIYLGRKLANGECVHHINENPFDNRIENLIVFASSEAHMICHSRINHNVVKRQIGQRKSNIKKRLIYFNERKYQFIEGDIVLFGPKYHGAREARLKMFAEKMKRDFGLM